MEEVKTGDGRRKRAAILVSVLVTIIGAGTLFFYLRYKATHITTDDAFVEGDIHTIASKVDGTVKQVYVKSNQFVKKGDVLVALDSADFDVKVREARAALEAEVAKTVEIESRLEAAKRQLSEYEARADAVGAVLDVQKANLEQAERDVKRAEGLFKTEAYSKERYEKTVTAHKVAVAQVKAATEGVRNMTLSVETQRAVIKQAEAVRVAQRSAIDQSDAVLKNAELKSGYTMIHAPADGYVTKKSVEVGNQIKTGQPLMALVPLDDVYVVANYKETQLEKVKPGQKVEIKVDTYPGKTFNGKVESIMAGTGAVFSLFPPENATGNYVKVVQRIPVKILLDKDADKEHILRVGMSVVPTIIVK